MSKKQGYVSVLSATPSGRMVEYAFTPNCCVYRELQSITVDCRFDASGRLFVTEGSHPVLTDLVEDCLVKNPTIEITQTGPNRYLLVPRNGSPKKGKQIPQADFLKELVVLNTRK